MLAAEYAIRLPWWVLLSVATSVAAVTGIVLWVAVRGGKRQR